MMSKYVFICIGIMILCLSAGGCMPDGQTDPQEQMLSEEIENATDWQLNDASDNSTEQAADEVEDESEEGLDESADQDYDEEIEDEIREELEEEDDSSDEEDDSDAISGDGEPISESELEKEIHRLINMEREKNSAGVLSYDEVLAEAARNHSKRMAEEDFFSHDGFAQRSMAISYRCSAFTIAENIYREYKDTSKEMHEIASSTVSGWMRSTGHKENILNPDYHKQGIGVAIDFRGNYLVTEILC